MRLRLAHWVAELFDTQLPYFKGARQMRNMFTRLLAPTLRPPQRISTRYGFDTMITTAHDSIDYQLFARGTYEAGTLNVISNCLREGDTFIDVGANIGLMSLLAARRVGNSGAVYAFEPAPDTFRLLQENIALNQMKNIRAVNVGLGAVQSAEVIYENRQDNRGMASFIDRDLETAVGVEVPVHTLDSFLAEQSVSTVRMMKIDVEGWELEVLKGASKLLGSLEPPILCLEYNTELPGHEVLYDLITSISAYQVYVLPHGNWHVSSLVRVHSAAELPAMRSFNVYCFLPVHLQSVSSQMFATK